MNSSQADGNVLFVLVAHKKCKFISYHISVSTFELCNLLNNSESDSIKFLFDIDTCVAGFSTFVLSIHIYCPLYRYFSKIFAYVLFV